VFSFDFLSYVKYTKSRAIHIAGYAFAENYMPACIKPEQPANALEMSPVALSAELLVKSRVILHRFSSQYIRPDCRSVAKKNYF